MKKIAATVLIIAFSFTSAGLALAKDKKEGKVSAAEIKVKAEVKETAEETQEIKGEPSDVKEAVQEVKPKVSAEGGSASGRDEAALEQARKKRQEELKVAKVKLGGQEWVIYLTSLIDRKSLGSDTLKFVDGKITAKELLAKGYLESNCTITPQEDGTVVWETMQVHENGDRVFWRGELISSLMQGVMSRQSKDGKTEDISFTTTAPKTTEEKIEPEKDKQTNDTPKNKRDKGKK